MSDLKGELRLMRRGLDDRVARLQRMATRLTPGPLLVRLVVFACGAGALAVAYAPTVAGPLAVAVMVVVGLLPALLPRSLHPTGVLFTSALGWLLTANAYAPQVNLARLAALSILLYLLHSSAALAAVLPYDTVVSPRVLVRWFARAGGVVVLSSAFAFGVAVLAQRVGGRTYLVASLAGLAAAVGLGALLARARRTH